jgi:hypothetical protein
MLHQLSKTGAFNADGDLQGTFVFSKCGEILAIRGFVFDVVRDVALEPCIWGKFLENGPGWENLHKSVSYEVDRIKEIDAMSEAVKPYPTGQDSLLVAAETLTCNQAFSQTGTKNTRLDDQAVVEEYEHYKSQLQKVHAESSATTGMPVWEKL